MSVQTVQEAVAKSLALWQAAYPNIELKPETPLAWEHLLEDLEPESIVHGFKVALQQSEIPALPPVGKIRTWAKEHARRRRRLQANWEAERLFLLALPQRTEEEEQRLRDLSDLAREREAQDARAVSHNGQ